MFYPLSLPQIMILIGALLLFIPTMFLLLNLRKSIFGALPKPRVPADILQGGPMPTRVKELVREFLEFISIPTNNTIQAPDLDRLTLAILGYTSSWNTSFAHLRQPNETVAFHSAAMAELSYPGHRFEVKFHIGMFTWFMLYIDDCAEDMPELLEGFQERFLARLPLQDPLLQKYAELLLRTYDHWDPLTANSIIAAGLEYVTATTLETDEGFRTLKLDKNAGNFAYYFRRKTGVAEAYALMLFPRQENPSRWAFLPAVADLNLFIDLSNDILSFYKEEKAGENTNYIHIRAKCCQEYPLSVLRKTVEESIGAAKRATLTLGDSTAAAGAWRLFKQGFV
ncbi:hypothetical protein HGRIS_005923 [Hohenbuehelia grisea]|uniref:Terpenoid synthase n=1 Tax=Hohenbuehelia grisea TaxID=104357 RepID=A0ABR3JZE0_9AGAR